MAEYTFHTAAPWVHAAGTSGTVSPSSLAQSRLRSLHPTPMNKHVTRAISTPQLNKVAQPTPLSRSDSEVMNTIPDPRAPTPQPVLTRNNSTDSHPDLSQEVATLSTKLVNAINHQTTIDDTLQHTRHELDATKEKLAMSETETKRLSEMVARGDLIDREVYEKMEKQLLSDLEEERRRRIDAEKAKRKVDGEIETLTSALFEEANTMVSAARKETEAVEKRNEQLTQQLKDAETVQSSLIEQMQDLKAVMERMSDRDDTDSTLPTTTAPSTPGITPADKMSKLFEAANLTPNTPGTDEVMPDHPLHFSHLIHPVLRSDLISIREFQEMLKISTRSAPTSRVSSGSYGGLNVLGLGSLTNNSTSSLPSTGRSPSSVGVNSPRDSVSGIGMPNLKDEKFYKRALVEDIEPTLRLDIAPALSWMARRTIISSITTGALVIEPNPPPPKFRGPVFPCSLCGESRKGDEYARKFRFKSSDTDDVRHPLCDYCLGRMRATCDYIGFLRLIAAGHWRAETEEEKKTAWEESVKLRERMFWARLGGGVVPSFVPMRDSPRSPTFVHGSDKGEAIRKSEESQVSEKPLDSAVDMTEPPKEMPKDEDDPFQTKEAAKRVSIGNTIISSDPQPVPSLSEEEENKIEEEVEAQLQTEVLKTMEVKEKQSTHQRSQSTPLSPDPSLRKKDERLSLTIPGAFE